MTCVLGKWCACILVPIIFTPSPHPSAPLFRSSFGLHHRGKTILDLAVPSLTVSPLHMGNETPTQMAALRALWCSCPWRQGQQQAQRTHKSPPFAPTPRHAHTHMWVHTHAHTHTHMHTLIAYRHTCTLTHRHVLKFQGPECYPTPPAMFSNMALVLRPVP